MKPAVPTVEKHFIRIGLIFAAVVIFAVGGVWTWQAPVKAWRIQHAVRQGVVYLNLGERHKAQLSARRALQLNPESTDARRLLADIARDSADPGELALRRSLALATGSFADRIALASAAVRARDGETARKALDAIPAAERDQAEYLAAGGSLAELSNNFNEAEKYLLHATELAPKNQTYRLSLAVLRLSHSELQGRDESRLVLRQLLDEPAFQKQAARALIGDALSRSDADAAIEFSEKLRSFPGAVFGDRLLYLGALQVGRRTGFSGELEKLELECGDDVAKSAALLQWLSASHLSIMAIEWARTRPVEMMSDIVFCNAVADCYESVGDWLQLRDLLRDKHWEKAEYVRLARLARAYRQLGDEASSRKSWDEALRLAAGEAAALNRLAHSATEWNWQDEAVAISWQLVKFPQFRKSALSFLSEVYSRAHDTAGLYRVTVAQMEDRPDDGVLQNNRAQLALLLDVATPGEIESAKRNFGRAPNDADIASTYAFSLYRARDFDGAVRIMEALPSSSFEKPAIAAYYGILLAASGRGNDAIPFLLRADTRSLLPEEQRLVREAQRGFTRAD